MIIILKGYLSKALGQNFQGQNGFVILFHHNIQSNEINWVLRVGKTKDAFHKNWRSYKITVQNPGVLDTDNLNTFLYNVL